MEPTQTTAEKAAVDEVAHDKAPVPLFGERDQRRDDSTATEPAAEWDAKPQSTSAVATEPPLSTEILAPPTSDEPAIEHDQACKHNLFLDVWLILNSSLLIYPY